MIQFLSTMKFVLAFLRIELIYLKFFPAPKTIQREPDQPCGTELYLDLRHPPALRAYQKPVFRDLYLHSFSFRFWRNRQDLNLHTEIHR